MDFLSFFNFCYYLLILSLSAPCPPTNLTVKTECGTNLAILTWAPSTYAISYTTTLTGTHGHVVSCTANTTSCSMKVDCGHQYSAVVVASTATCNSTASPTLTFYSLITCRTLLSSTTLTNCTFPTCAGCSIA